MINHHIIARLWEGKAQSTYHYTMKEFHPAVWENLYIYSKQGHNKGLFWTFKSWEDIEEHLIYRFKHPIYHPISTTKIFISVQNTFIQHPEITKITVMYTIPDIIQHFSVHMTHICPEFILVTYSAKLKDQIYKTISNVCECLTWLFLISQFQYLHPD